MKRSKMVRRSGLEIVRDILLATSQEAKPTRIMYLSNISWQPLKRRMDSLVELGWVKRSMVSWKTDKRSSAEYSLTRLGQEKLKSITAALKELEVILDGRSSVDSIL